MSALPLSAGELVQMRDTVDGYLAGTAVIHTATSAVNLHGRETRTYAASGTVDARLSPDPAGSEQLVGGRVAEVSPWILTIPQGTSIDEDDRVVYNSVTYEVVEVLTRVPWELARRVRLVEVD